MNSWSIENVIALKGLRLGFQFQSLLFTKRYLQKSTLTKLPRLFSSDTSLSSTVWTGSEAAIYLHLQDLSHIYQSFESFQILVTKKLIVFCFIMSYFWFLSIQLTFLSLKEGREILLFLSLINSFSSNSIEELVCRSKPVWCCTPECTGVL